MKVVKAGFQILKPQSPTKHIERVARVCYKSEDKICEGSDIKMIKSLLSRQHLAMIEHASVCIETDQTMYEILQSIVTSAETYTVENVKPKHFYLRFTDYTIEQPHAIYGGGKVRYLVSGNLRAWYEFMEYFAENVKDMELPFIPVIVEAAGGKDGVLGKWHKDNFVIADDEEIVSHWDMKGSKVSVITDFSALTDEERWVHETISVHFTVDRGVTHEMVRMRDCSFAQESTRYCNYSKGKFGSDITVIKPCFWDENSRKYIEWHQACILAERAYLHLTDAAYGEPAQPQQARSVLPQSVKAEIVMTTNLREWHHILSLRACDSTGPAHPQMKEVMIPLLAELKEDAHFASIFADLHAAA